MPIESEADRLEYLRTFGLCIQTDRGSLLGIFDREGQPSVVGELEVTTSSPAVAASTAEVLRLGLKRGDSLIVDGTAYTVRELRRDGTGMTTIGLDEA